MQSIKTQRTEQNLKIYWLPISRNIRESFNLVPYDRLLRKIAASGVDKRVVIWIREFLLGRSQSQIREAIMRENLEWRQAYLKGLFWAHICS
jgi:hypothetical protein